MSIRKLFDDNTPYKIFSETPEDIRKDAEFFENVNQTIIEKETFILQLDIQSQRTLLSMVLQNPIMKML